MFEKERPYINFCKCLPH